MGPLLNVADVLMTKCTENAEVLNALFPSAFTGETLRNPSSHDNSLKVWSNADLHSEEDQVREHKLVIHKSTRTYPQVQNELADTIAECTLSKFSQHTMGKRC